MARTRTGTFSFAGRSGSRGKLFGAPGVRLEGTTGREATEELERKIRRMQASLAAKQVAEALAVGGEVIRRTAEAIAPRAAGGPTRDSGHGADRIVMEVIETGPSRAAAWVGASKKAFWLSIQETGTLYHPAQPWLIPAFDEERQHALTLTAEAMRKKLLFGVI
jgi:HK97 gp10 family phage protein